MIILHMQVALQLQSRQRPFRASKRVHCAGSPGVFSAFEAGIMFILRMVKIQKPGN